MIRNESKFTQISPRNRWLKALVLGCWFFVAFAALFLSISNGYHKLVPFSYRQNFAGKIQTYTSVINQLDQARSGKNDFDFVVLATKKYLSGSAYIWPKELTRVSYRDNWVLWGLAYFDSLRDLATGEIHQTYTIFESYRYERALGRGFGICSQQALGLADLLTSRYGIPTRMVGLSGHVILEAEVGPGQFILSDPSVGLVLPFSYVDIESNLDYLKAAYRQTAHPELAEKYDWQGNVKSPFVGSGRYWMPFKMQAVKYVELISDYLSVALALLMFILATRRIKLNLTG